VVGGVFAGHPNAEIEAAELTIDPDFENYDPVDAKGITTPRDEYFSIEGASFHNFDSSDLSSAIFTCSQCDEGEDRDAARTTFVKELAFDDLTVPKRLRFNSPFRDIVVDVDGSLTGAADQTVVRYGKHFDPEDCSATEEQLTQLDGVICQSHIQVRRVSWHSPQPWGNLGGQRINLLRWDQDLVDSMTAEELETYRSNVNNY